MRVVFALYVSKTALELRSSQTLSTMGYHRFKGVFVSSMCLWLCYTLVVVGEAAEVGNDSDWLESAESSDAENSQDEIVVSSEDHQQKQATTLRCHRRFRRAKVEQQDASGKRCWDILALESCWGRCDSHEISEWKFPYKRSKHPVCGFGARRGAVARLQHCEEGAAPETRIYHHVKPVTCRCRACSSSDTSCGWLPDFDSLSVQRY